MPYHFCSWYDTRGIFVVPHFGFGHSIFVLRCLVIRLQWQQNVISDISDRVLLYRMWRRIQDCTMCTTSEGKGKRSIAVRNTPHRYGNSHAVWDHTVLPATRQRWHEHAVEATKNQKHQIHAKTWCWGNTNIVYSLALAYTQLTNKRGSLTVSPFNCVNVVAGFRVIPAQTESGRSSYCQQKPWPQHRSRSWTEWRSVTAVLLSDFL